MKNILILTFSILFGLLVIFLVSWLSFAFDYDTNNNIFLAVKYSLFTTAIFLILKELT